MYYGSDFYRISQLELSDVRLVYAPPRAIGNYGDEIDNFMWPRHTGDFTLLRAYVGKDGKPAPYSKDNVPYQAPAHLQMSLDGPKEGDYAMLAGYPGITYRHRTAAEFAGRSIRAAARVAVFQQLIDTIEAPGKLDADAATRYASQLQSLKNNRKRAAGELEGLLRSDAPRCAPTNRRCWRPPRRRYQAIAQLRAQLDRRRGDGERDLLLALMAARRSCAARPCAGAPAHRIGQARRAARKRLPAARPGLDRRRAQAGAAPPRAGGGKALLTTLLTRYQQLPDAQRVPSSTPPSAVPRRSWPPRWTPCTRPRGWASRPQRLSRFAAAREASRWPTMR
jgi:hypothetical protein